VVDEDGIVVDENAIGFAGHVTPNTLDSVRFRLADLAAFLMKFSFVL
jgi:hypothetical protein